MSHHTNAGVSPDIAATLPPRDLLRQVLTSHIIEIPAGCNLVRAAWNTAEYAELLADPCHMDRNML